MKRALAQGYGAACYLMFWGALACCAALLANDSVVSSVDAPLPAPPWQALSVNVALLAAGGGLPWAAAFAHRRIGLSLPVQRPTCLLGVSLALLLLCRQWQPFGGVIWDVQHPAGQWTLHALFALGWCAVLYAALPAESSGPFQLAGQPLCLGLFVAVWAAPTMTGSRLLIAAGLTAWLLATVLHGAAVSRSIVPAGARRSAIAGPAARGLDRGR
jgi:hypothetical protein